MLKKALLSMVLLGMSVAPLFAQSNVEKARRFRAKAPNPEVVVQSDAATRVEQEKETPRIPIPLRGSSAQRLDLGGFAWNSSGSQLEDLGCPYCNRGNVFSTGQLEDLGGYIWSSSGGQLKNLGPTARPRVFSAGQLEDLGQSRYAVGIPD